MNTLFFVALAVVAWSGLILFFACKLEECNNKRISHVGWDWHESTMDHMVCEPEPIRYYRGDAHPTVGGLIWSSSGAGPNGTPSGRWVTPEELVEIDEYDRKLVEMISQPKKGFITVAQKELADGKITYQQYAFRLFMDHATDKAGDAYSDCAEMSGNFQYGEYDQDDYDDFEVMCDRQEVLEGRMEVIQEVNLIPYIMGSGKDKRMFLPSSAYHMLVTHAEKLANRSHQSMVLWCEENECCMPEYDYTDVAIERHDNMLRVCELNSGTIVCRVYLKTTPDISGPNMPYWRNESFIVGMPSSFIGMSQTQRNNELSLICHNYVDYMRSEGKVQVEVWVGLMEWIDFEVAYIGSEN